MLVRLGLAGLRLQRGWYLLLALMVSLIAGFCAALPLYMDQLAEASTQHIVADLSQEKANIALYNPQPIDRSIETILSASMGDLFTREIRFSRATGPGEIPTLGKICGYAYAEGEPLTANSRYAYSPAEHCYIVYSFDSLHDIFQLTLGDLPQPRDIPAPPDPSQPLIMGEAQVEAAITSANAAQTGLTVGDRIVVGDHPNRAVVVEIVGIVDPVFDPDSVFWHSHGVVLSGEWTPYGDDMRLDIGLIVADQTFVGWMPVLAPNVYYAWWLDVPPAAITADRLRTLGADLGSTMQNLRLTHPDIALVSGLTALSEQFDAAVAEYRGAVFVEFGAILLWFAAQLAVTATLIFGDRRAAWEILFQHGATRRQMVRVMLLGLPAVGVTGIIVGLLAAKPLLTVFGLAALPDGATPLTGMLLLSAGGVVLASAALGVAAWRVARGRHLHTAHPYTARPPRPAWLRYALDGVLLAGGIAMTARLYTLIDRDLQSTLRDLLLDPVTLTQHAVATNSANTLADPANVIGPLMIAVGAALVSLRAITLLLRLPARVVARHKPLTGALALWRITRGPGRYGLLVITLVVTALLVASAAVLDATRESAARRYAQHEVGADARLSVDPSALPPDHAWTVLPGVTHAAPVMALRADPQTTSLLGVMPETMQPLLPDVPAALAALRVPDEALPGVPLPDNAVTLQLKLLSEAQPENPGDLTLDCVLLDTRGVVHYAPMIAQQDGSGPFVTLRAVLDDQARWRLIGIRMASTHFDTHTFFIDDIAAVDTQGAVTVIDDFEAPDSTRWTVTLDQSINVLETQHSTAQAASGTGSQKIAVYVKYTRAADLRPVLLAADNLIVEMSVIVSETFAAREQKRARSDAAFGVGSTGLMRLDLPLGTFSLSYRIVGIVDAFPTASDASFVVAPLDALRIATNLSRTKTGVYDTTHVWLDLDRRAPDAALRAALHDMPGVTETLFAHDRYVDLSGRADAVAIGGMLRVGSGVAALLSLLSVTVFLALRFATQPQAFRPWYTLGWRMDGARRAELVELLIIGALATATGILAALVLVTLLLPFLATLGNEVVSVPVLTLGLLLGGMTLAPAAILLAEHVSQRHAKQ